MYFVILTPDKVSGYCDVSPRATGELRVVVSMEMYNMYDSRERLIDYLLWLTRFVQVC